MHFWNRGMELGLQATFSYSFVSELLLKLTVINNNSTTTRYYGRPMR